MEVLYPNYNFSTTLDELPEDIFFHIFSFIKTPTLLLTAANVCSKWRTICGYSFSFPPDDKEEECADLSALANSTFVTVTTILKCLGYTFKYSKKLKITACFEIDDTKLLKLAENNTHLTYLNIYGCRHISSEGIERACALLPNLEHLDIRECSRVSPQTIKKLESMIESVEHGETDPYAHHPDIPLLSRPGEEQQFLLCCQVLKLPAKPTVVHMKKSYVKLSREYHPDKQFNLWDKRIAHEKFIALDNAYKYLSSLA